jgi:hypothetical protein
MPWSEISELRCHEPTAFTRGLPKLLWEPRLSAVTNSDVEVPPELLSDAEGVRVIDLRLRNVR